MSAALSDTYVEPSVVDVGTASDAVRALFAIQRSQDLPEYSAQAFEVDTSGAILQDLTPYLAKNDDYDALAYDCTANTAEDMKFTLSADAELTWGSSIVALYQLIRSTRYNADNGLQAGAYLRFPLGQFVVTSPGFDDLDASDVREVTGYGKNYLLQNEPGDALSFDAGTLYSAAIQQTFAAAGVIPDDGTLLSTVCDFPGTWITKKTLTPHSYPMGEGTYLDVVNDLLKSSGCRDLFVQKSGRWLIQLLLIPSQQGLRWRWAASEDDTVTDLDLDARIVLSHQSKYTGDTWNAPNRWYFVQTGLDFPPGFDGATDGSSGLYQYDNVSIPPTDQASVGRVVSKTVMLDASGQADLVAQGAQLVSDDLSQAETVDLETCPWPAAGHYDVFQLTHAGLPDDSVRRVQAQSWELPLWGNPMRWKTNVVAAV